MDLEGWGIAFSLGALSVVLGVLSARGFLRALRKRAPVQALWGIGLGFGAAATAIELVAFVGFASDVLLQAYVFFSAAIVGVLSMGSMHAFRQARWAKGYLSYAGASIALVAFFSFTTPMPLSMIVNGVIAQNPPLFLLVLSSFVTVPATVVLLAACVLSLRRRFRWQGLLMLSGATVLGAGGAFYVASFPVMLYYAEFLGIVLLFFGLVDFSRWAQLLGAPAPRPIEKTA
jgi:hypothetical protein